MGVKPLFDMGNLEHWKTQLQSLHILWWSEWPLTDNHAWVYLCVCGFVLMAFSYIVVVNNLKIFKPSECNYNTFIIPNTPILHLRRNVCGFYTTFCKLNAPSAKTFCDYYSVHFARILMPQNIKFNQSFSFHDSIKLTRFISVLCSVRCNGVMWI